MIAVIYFWRIKPIHLPLAILHMALDRIYLRGNNKIKFYKSLGTGKGETFTPGDANALRWGLLVTLDSKDFEAFNNSVLINSWRKFSVSEYRANLQPISSRGMWAGNQPFEENQIQGWNGKIAAITRARIKWNLNSKFFKSVPPVTLSLKNSPGLLGAIGIGEAPIGLQGTFSRWSSAQDIRNFAYNGAAHSTVIDQTRELNWYAEELFARFAILEEHGEF